ncbi:MAG: class I SAM-dependent methyltransferase [Kiloniellales bacterium]|nr:class I SAM-dependent methyltransferase [Kiloniellales bacterium]
MTRPTLRAGFRRLRFGLQTVLGLAPRGFFIPYRYAGDVTPPGQRQPYPAAEARLAAAAPGFREVLGWIQELADDLKAIGTGPQDGPGRPARWTQDWFPRLDAAAAYALTRRLRPARIIEVGAGHSTRFFARAVADGGLESRLCAIDPAPRARLEGLAVEHRQSTLQAADPGVFAGLGPGDFLSIDSSHVAMPGSDVDFLFGRVLPDLPAGALLHIHDVFLPDDYPADWAWRGYNEQLLAVQLLDGDRWELVFASHYVATRLTSHLAGHVVGELPLSAGARESSLWLRRR